MIFPENEYHLKPGMISNVQCSNLTALRMILIEQEQKIVSSISIRNQNRCRHFDKWFKPIKWSYARRQKQFPGESSRCLLKIHSAKQATQLHERCLIIPTTKS